MDESVGYAKQLEAALGLVDEPVIVVDSTGALVFANAAGLSVAESLGLAPRPSLADSPATRTPLAQSRQPGLPPESPITAALRGESSERRRYRLAGPNGHVAYELSATPVRDESGEVSGAVCVGRAIVEPTPAEQALRESQRALATLMSNLPGMAYRCRNDRDWTMEFVSDGGLDLTGYPPSDLVDNRVVSYNDLIAPDDREPVWRQVQEAVDSRLPFHLAYRIRARQGQEKCVSEIGRGVFSDDEALVALEGFITDITDRVVAETKLRESEARYRSLFEDASIPTWEEDLSAVRAELERLRSSGVSDFRAHFERHPDSVVRCADLVRVLAVNEESVRFFGVSDREHMPASITAFFIGDSWPVFREKLVALAEGSARFQAEFPLRTLDGEQKVVALRLSVAPGYEESLARVLVSFYDLTASKQAERLREEYVSLISHDLRNPLTVLTGHADVLAKLLASQGRPREARSAKVILTSARRMNSMIQDLVDSARLEGGRLEVRSEVADLCGLVREVVDRIGGAEECAQVRVSCPAGPVNAPVDPERIERAIVNLLTNALKYSPACSPVEVVVRSRGGDAVVSITDHGVGIPTEELPHLFQRHFRASTAEKVEGLGLGLYITRLIVEAHGGRIWATSEVGRGSTFSFSLPLAQAS